MSHPHPQHPHQHVLPHSLHRPDPVQLDLRAHGRHLVGDLLHGRHLLLGNAAAAAGHRLRRPAARGADPALQPRPPQTGRPGAQRTRPGQEDPVTPRCAAPPRGASV
ncbi:hypothetical protein ANANG_G00063010 [Anguilla anguilla]|uniref:Uncharacterized protein n=1 Tax=Anguilla anguilla TaxID=7936 RepID=A0A9D3S2Q7_ANGAN|nr:hypothetical protein ANANG_G00063010 [Anguilla anguilla]